MANVSPPASTLAAFNAAPAEAAERDLLACCASGRFAKAVTDGRPYAEPDALSDAVDTAFAALSWDDIVESMNAHPRIGDRPAAAGPASAGPASAGWSATEQSGTAAASEAVRQGLAEGNLAYEKHFGHVFLICASGLSGREMLNQLQTRLKNDPQTERTVVRQELLKITQLRLAKLLSI